MMKIIKSDIWIMLIYWDDDISNKICQEWCKRSEYINING